MFSIDAVLDKKLPDFSQNHPLLRRTLSQLVKYICHERAFEQFAKKYPHCEGLDFIEQVLHYFEFNYRVFDRELERIPTTGRAVLVANHPLGSLDGIALLKMISEVRHDVRIVANEMLYAIKPLRSLLLPVDNISNKTRKDSIRSIKKWLENDGIVIIFPAGEVSRFSSTGIKDGYWNSGFLRFAKSTNAPILPIYINGRNSLFFYALSLLAKPISTLWLIREMFKQANQHVDIHIGHAIYPEQYQRLDISMDAQAKLIKKHVYRLGKGKSVLGFEPDYETIAHPENRQLLKREVLQCESLGETGDGKKIYLYHYQTNSVIMREIGRLREVTFRKVKEGTGKRRDIDIYDHYYDHIILWDDTELEIVGAYRMMQSAKAMSRDQDTPLYTQTLFNYTPEFNEHLENGLELGRSFIQPKFWGMRSLDYLWYGIGAYLRKYPEIKYLFGPVSLSQSYSEQAIHMMVYFYSEYFPTSTLLVNAKNEYLISDNEREAMKKQFTEQHTYQEKFTHFKRIMADMEESIPTLFKQYTELCEPGGSQFAAFNIDMNFSDCIDGFIIIDTSMIKASKRKRYIG
jgi:putative hemolysin